MKKIVVFLLLASIPFIYSCRQQQTDVNSFSRKVKIMRVQKDSAHAVKSFPGLVREAKAVNLAFRVAGPIKNINVQEGDYVKAGQLIAEMDTRDYQIQANVASAQYEQVKAETERVKELYNRKSATQAEYEKAVAGEKMVKAQLEHAQDQLNDTKLYAPFSGYIQKINYEEGELINTGMTLATLLNTKSYEVQIDLPENLFMLRDRFTSFSVNKVSSNSSIPLSLVSYQKKANSNQLYKFIFRATSGENKLSPGMPVSVNIAYSTENENPLYLPIKAVFYQDGKSNVWIYNAADSTITRQEVITDGLMGDADIRIVSGLTGNEMIVVTGVNMLHEHDKVEAMEEVSETNVGGLL